MPLSWPSQGQYASTTFFVTDDELQLRISRFNTPLRTLALLTDGLERLALDFATTAAHVPFFSAIAAPVQASVAQGRDSRLSEALRSYLGSDRINERTDDDKTLLVAVLR